MRVQAYVAALSVLLMVTVVAGCSQGPQARTTGSLPTIALMTDFGESDFYVGAVKGVIRSIAPTVTIDHYGNLHTSVPGEMLAALSLTRGDLADVTIGEVTKAVRLMSTYGDVPEGEPLIFIASTEHLEIAVNRGSAPALFAAKPNSLVRIAPHHARE
jgi:S-adenosylmethionine hydrolase